MKYAYIRVSSTSQSLDVQREQVKLHEPDEIFEETASGTKDEKDRKELDKLLQNLKEGDVLIVTKIDRLARNVKSLLRMVEYLDKIGVSLEIINCNGLDISGAMGRLVLTILGAVAAFENDMRRERQMEGILAAKIRGVYNSRPRKNECDRRRSKIAETIIHLRKAGYSAARISRQLRCTPRDIHFVLVQNGLSTKMLKPNSGSA